MDATNHNFNRLMADIVIAGIAARRGTPYPTTLLDLFQASICSLALARAMSPKEVLEIESANAPDAKDWETTKQDLIERLDSGVRLYVKMTEESRVSHQEVDQ